MELFLTGHDCKYAVEQIMLMLFPGERPVYPDRPGGGLSAAVKLGGGEKLVAASTTLTAEGRKYYGAARVDRRLLDGPVEADRLIQRAIKLSFYRAGIKYLGKKPAWGALSGVRPTKLMRRLLEEQGGDASAAEKRFKALYDVSDERTRLCLETARVSLRTARGLGDRDVCLYLGVPFCPTRCAYCSFVSQSVEKSLALTEPFVQSLALDIAATAGAVAAAGLRVVAVYFGGGTPTTLDAGQLERVLSTFEESFDLSSCREFTVEAGRPDTISAEKLEVLARHGVSRISVNPQTMSDAVLETIGRRHTAAQVVSAMELVRRAGGMEVNMDLIAGLPGDSFEGFGSSLDRVLELGAENITVHTLSLKKGSRITLEAQRLPDESEVERMLDLSRERLRSAGYSPYYLYRQKYMSGGFENIGWSLAGSENLYNICVMEELCGIISMGAGASTKLTVGDGRLKRFFSPKYPREYIDGIDAVCADKEKIKEFYNGLSTDRY